MVEEAWWQRQQHWRKEGKRRINKWRKKIEFPKNENVKMRFRTITQTLPISHSFPFNLSFFHLVFALSLSWAHNQFHFIPCRWEWHEIEDTNVRRKYVNCSWIPRSENVLQTHTYTFYLSTVNSVTFYPHSIFIYLNVCIFYVKLLFRSFQCEVWKVLYSSENKQKLQEFSTICNAIWCSAKR